MVFASRQPVLDGAMGVVGYRITYALHDGYELTGAHPAVLFDTALSLIGLSELVGDGTAHLPVTSGWLRELGGPPLRPDRTILRLDHEDASDPAVWPVLEQARQRGYALELDGLPWPGVRPEVLELFDIFELNATVWNPASVARFAAELRERGRTPLVANVGRHADRDEFARLGCQWFTGPFSGTPRLVPGRKIPTGELARMAALVRMNPETSSFEEVVAMIEQDLGLSVRLLRYLNSAYFGSAATVSSVHDAALRLGSRNVARWALTIAVAGAPNITREVAVMALTRARLCELLAGGSTELASGEMFTIGLLSAADVVFGTELAEIIGALPLTSRITDALIAREGPAGEILSAALAYERGDFDDPALARLITGPGPSFQSALGWAQDTLPGAE